MAGIPYGTRPQNLGPQVPPSVKDLPVPAAPQGMPQGKPAFDPNVPSEDVALEAAPPAAQAAAPAEKPPFDPGAPSEDIPGAVYDDQASPGVFQQLGELGTRVRNSFAMTPKEQKQVLADKFGAENVKLKDDEWFVKRKGDKKFTRFDPAGFDVGDVADFTRPVIEGAVSAPFTGAGAIAGTLAFPGLGTAGGIVVGNALGGLAGQAVGDTAAAALGIKRDEERNPALEYAASATLNALIPVAGKFAASTVKGGAKRVGALASTVAEATGLSKPAMSAWEAAGSYSKELFNDAQALAQAGKIAFLPGKGGKPQAVLLPHQIDPNNPEAVAFMKDKLDVPEVQKVLNQQAENAASALKSYVRSAAQIAGTAGDQTEEQLSNKAEQVMKDLTRREGQEVEKYAFRAKASVGANTPLKLSPEATDTLTQIQKELGFTFKSGAQAGATLRRGVDGIVTRREGGAGAKLVITDPNILVGKLGIQTPAEAKYYQKTFEDLVNKANGGGLTIDQYSEAIESLKPALDKAQRSGGAISGLLGRFQSELRQSRRDAIGSALPDSEKVGYTEVMDKISGMLGARDNLKQAFAQDLTNKAFVSKIVQGRDLGALKAAKTLFEKDAPEVWNSVKNNYVESLLGEAADVTSRTGLNSAGIKKDLMKLGPEAQKLIFSTKELPDLMKMLNVMERIEQTDMKAMSKDKMEKGAEAFVQGLASSVYMKAKAAYSLVKLGKDKKSQFFEVLNQEGLEKFLGNVPKAQRSRTRELLQGMTEQYRADSLYSKSIAEGVSGAAGTLGKQDIIQGQRTGTPAAEVQPDLQ